MSFKYFIDTVYLKENTPIQDNLDPKLVQMTLQEAQQITLRDTIGSDLYDEIYGQFPGSLSAANNTLLEDYIKPILKYAVLQESLIPMVYKFRNNGVMKFDGAGQTPITLEELRLIEAGYAQKKDHFIERMNRYLCLNPALYPKWQNPSAYAVDQPNRDGQNYGFFFPKG
jgi:hypothetical protein